MTYHIYVDNKDDILTPTLYYTHKKNASSSITSKYMMKIIEYTLF